MHVSRKLRRLASLAVSLPALALAAAILLAISCTPVWLPNSSGFLFIGAGGSVVRYTISGEEKVILPPGSVQQPLRISLRSDGSQFAFAVHDTEGDDGRAQTVAFRIYSVDGEFVHESKTHRFTVEGKPDKERRSVPFGELNATRCYWSPDEKLLLGLLPSARTCVIYDLESHEFHLVAGALPLLNPLVPDASTSGLMLFDVPPVAPTGAGFVVMQAGKESDAPKLALVDWKEHVVRPIELPKMAIDAEHKAYKEDDFALLLLPSRWEKGMLEIPGKQGVLRIDTGLRQATYAATEQVTRLADHARRLHVAVLAEFAGGNLLQMTKDQKLQVWRRDTREVRDVLALGEGFPAAMAPSQNGRMIVLYLIGGAGDEPQIVLVDSTGTVLHQSKQGLEPAAPRR